MNKLLVLMILCCTAYVTCKGDNRTLNSSAHDDDSTRYARVLPKKQLAKNQSIQQRATTKTKINKKFKKLHPPNCGYNNGSRFRIVNGIEAQLNAWPWMAAIGFRITVDGTIYKIFTCGGSLITNRHLLTAAHCMNHEDGMTFLVRLGAHNLDSDDSGAHPMDFDVRNVIVHPNYKKATKENDIAVLTLNSTVTFTEAIHPICLPLAPQIRHLNLTGSYPFLAGWGSTVYGESTSDVLLETQLPVVDNRQCHGEYNKTKVVIDRRILCAGFPDARSDACQGDSGGPLMLQSQEHWYQIGIVSSGIRCAVPGRSGIYTRVSEFLDFILSNLT